MAAIQRFEEIEAWQTARELTRLIYSLSETGQFARDFGLRDQMRRVAVSIMSNVAEGYESRTRSLFIEYLGRAKASCPELRAQTYIAQDVGYLNPDQFNQVMQLAEKCGRQIHGFMEYLKQPDRKNH